MTPKLDSDVITSLAITTGVGLGIIVGLLELSRFGSDNALTLGIGVGFLTTPLAFCFFRKVL
jgi:uncharacterized transporter YbjL